MLTCPICQTTLDNDSIQGGRCFSCGSQVTWQCAPDELAHAGTATLAGGATSDTTKQTLANGMPPAEGGFGESNTATMRSIESEFIPTDASPPKQKKFVYPAKPRPKPKSRALSIEQNNALKTIWGNTLDSDATPMTSLRSDAYVQETKKSSLVIRSRALARRIDGPQSINADYELIDHIGEGGMGVVHSARQASIDRTVAVKMLRREIADLREPREKFLSEAVVTAELDHPNIVPIHDLGASADGALFYSMKLVKGTPWCEAIFEKSLDENLSILLKVCDAVRFAHTKGVIHRDLKPENVMLGDFGEVLVMDWGLAVATSAFRCPDSITQSGNMGGTPAYMAPEMATGPIDAIDETSDVYLLGAILYEILTNKTPHFGRDPMDCLKAAAANRIQPTNVSGELMDIAMKAMSTEQMDRHSSVRSFQDSIQDYQSHAESILLSDRSEMSLQSALESEDYQEFASALHGFKEALLLWSDNPAAKSGLPQSRLEYATCAYGKEDYDLALSLLDSADPDHAALLANIERKRAERATRQKRLNGLKRIAVALFGIVIAIGALAFIMIRNDRNRAIAAHHTATAKMKEAEVAKAQEEKQRLAAVGNQKKAEQAQAAAEESAKRAADNAAEAKRLETEAARESYLALIGLAAARADENAFREANNILNGLASSPFRNWEWGRLKHVCSGTNKQFNASGRVESVSIDRSFQRVAASTRNGHATIWTISGNSPPISLPHKDHWVHGVAFSPDGRHVATACSDRMIRLFDVSSGQLLSSKEAHRDSVLQVAFSPNGSRLVSCSYDKSIAVWNVEDPRNVSISQRLQGHSWWVHDVGFSPDGNKIASAGHDGKVLVWQQDGDVSGQFKLLTEFSGHDGPVFSVRFSPDSKLLATGGHDKRVMVWDYERQDTTSIQEQLEGALAAPPVYRAFDGHRAAVRCVSFSPDGQRIVSGSVDNTLKVWDTKTGELHRTLRGHEREVRAAAFSPDGRQVVSGSFDESVRIWDVGEYRESRMLGTATVDGHTDAVMDARFSRNGKTIVTASRDRTARLWNADSGTIAQELVEGHDYLASIALFFPDGKHLLTAGGDNTVRIWDVVTGTQTQAYSGTGRDGIVALSPNSDRFATALGKHVGVWDLATGKQVRELGPHSANVTAVCYSQQFIGTADNAGGIKFWNEASGELLWESHAHNSTVTAMHISRDGQRLITASGDRTVGQWRTSDGKEIAAPLQHPDWISSIAVDADGNIAITSCEDS
ncbi:MAG: protein kinase, partial [Planctomycetales bacterium]|nr:protein kinase [Planctomycetales bacterium]